MNFETYLTTSDDKSRLAMLQSNPNVKIPYRTVEQLLYLPLPSAEKIALLNCAGYENTLEWEKVLIRGIEKWDTGVKSHAIRTWAMTTGHILLPSFERLLLQPHIGQRALYSLVDVGASTLGSPFVAKVFSFPGIEDYSPTFHGILMLRALETNQAHPSLDALAKRYLLSLSSRQPPGFKSASSAGKGELESIFWLLRYDPSFLHEIRFQEDVWNSLIKNLLLPISNKGWLSRLETELKGGDLERICDSWPLLPYRNNLNGGHLSSLFQTIGKSHLSAPLKLETVSELVKGVAIEILQSSLLASPDLLKAFDHYAPALEGPLCLLYDEKFRKKLALKLGAEANINGRLGLLLNPTKMSNQNWQLLEKLSQGDRSALNGIQIPDEHPINAPVTSPMDPIKVAHDPLKDGYFNLVYGLGRDDQVPVLDSSSTNYWQLLVMSHATKNGNLIEPLSHASRKQPYLYRLAAIRALGRFEGNDQAALKLMDHIRTQNVMELQEVVLSLGSLGTSRSLQELVGCLSRPNISSGVQLEICRILKEKDTTKIQLEIKSALSDLSRDPTSDDVHVEVREALASMIQLRPSGQTEVALEQNHPLDLDGTLSQRIPTYSALSSEIKRALRTAQFFHNQVQKEIQAELIELSPIIDMQCKALELLFRESFEDKVTQLIQEGKIQRRLDVLGYSRPIPASMDEFENYIASLPIVKDIPFFSRFKLRKLLRSFCQYQPGRRFTLDGIKAFALFFLVFSRKECPFGLSQYLPLKFDNDRQLADFVRQLHLFQDFRNRAAHEGFRPDDRQDIESIWNYLTIIIATTHELAPPTSRHKLKAAS
ncbi:MAG: HEAT repeat domain-containing protein [Pseudomonadota bacterium]